MYCTRTCINRSGTWGWATDKAMNKYKQPVEPERKQEKRDWCLFLVQAVPICVTHQEHCERFNSHRIWAFLMCRFLLFSAIFFFQIKVKIMLISCGKNTAHWVTQFIKLFSTHTILPLIHPTVHTYRHRHADQPDVYSLAPKQQRRVKPYINQHFGF